jgi:AAT family amino acid transporter
MVSTLALHGLNVAAGTVNFVLVTAILSAMLASVFGLGRMLRSLADGGDAPAILIDRGDVPLRGILFSGIAMLLGVSTAFVLPDRIYLFLVSSGGFSLLLTYLVIMLTHLRYRAQFGCPPRGNCQLPGYPYTTWAAIISLIIVIVTMPLIPGQGSGLFAGLVLLGMFAAAYYLFRAGPLASVPAAKPFTVKIAARLAVPEIQALGLFSTEAQATA